MIHLKDLMNIFDYCLCRVTNKDMYCICYDDGKDKRLLTNYGLFKTEESCIEYINSISNNNLIAHHIKINKENYKTFLTAKDLLSYGIKNDINYLYDCLQYFHKTEVIVVNRILKDIDNLLDEGQLNGTEIIQYIISEYQPLSEKDLAEMIPLEYNELVYYHVNNKSCISFDKDL